MNAVSLFAEVAWRAYSLGDLAIFVVIVAAVAALVFIGMRAMGVSPPEWAIQVAWVLVIAFVVIFAIRLVLSM